VARKRRLAAWVAALERIVGERPTQWFNFFDVWSPPAA
jgi:predicted LPLAT superfamily acyltransferase